MRIAGLSLVLVSAPALAQNVDLGRAFQAALERSESLSITRESVAQAEERHRQAVGAVLPSVSLIASVTKQETPENAPASFSDTSKGVRVTATQPLFRGLREFAALRQLDASKKNQEHLYRRAEQLLFADIADSYITVLAIERDLVDLDTELGYFSRRLKDLQERVKIGRSRATEVLAVEATAENLRATQASVRGQLAAARERFAFLSGLPNDTPLVPLPDSGEAIPSLEGSLKALEKRPDLTAARESVRAAEESVAIARGAHWPTLDLTGNYYPVREGSLEKVRWDAGLSLNLPIFSGGATQSKVRESASLLASSRLVAEQTRRQAEEETRSLHATVTNAREQVDRLRDATNLHEKNYKQLSRDYSYGLVSNLDVLQSLVSFQESQRAYDRARADFETNRVKLWVASGRLPPGYTAKTGD